MSRSLGSLNLSARRSGSRASVISCCFSLTQQQQHSRRYSLSRCSWREQAGCRSSGLRLRPHSKATKACRSRDNRKWYSFSYYPHFHFPQPANPEPTRGVEIFPTYLTVDFGNRKRSFDFAQLRDACKCPMCVDEHSKQRNFRSSDIPLSITPTNIQWDGKQLQVQWKDDIDGFNGSHVSKYQRDFLKFPGSNSLDDTSQRRQRYLWDGPQMEKLQHWLSYEDYMHDDAKFAVAMRHLSELGLIFVRGIPDSRDEVEKIATRIGPLRNTFYGPTWDVRSVPKAKNVAYTNVFLGFHMDLMYMNDPPCFQLLHCLQNSCDGGESMFADSYLAAVRLRKLRPEYFNILTRFPVNYEYVHKGHMYHQSRPVIEACRQCHKNHKKQRLEPGFFSFPSSHNVRSYINIHRVNYSPPFQGPQLARKSDSIESFGIDYRKFREALQFFTGLLESPDASFELKLEPGVCVIFENRRVLHARRQFNTTSGQRWLAGCYVDEDALLSCFRGCKMSHPEAWRCDISPRKS